MKTKYYAITLIFYSLCIAISIFLEKEFLIGYFSGVLVTMAIYRGFLINE